MYVYIISLYTDIHIYIINIYIYLQQLEGFERLNMNLSAPCLEAAKAFLLCFKSAQKDFKDVWRKKQKRLELMEHHGIAIGDGTSMWKTVQLQECACASKTETCIYV